MKLDKEEMKKRFWEITDEIESVLKESAESRKRIEKIREVLHPIKKDLDDMCAKVTKIEEPRIPNLKGELAMLSRALGTKIGPRPKK